MPELTQMNNQMHCKPNFTLPTLAKIDTAERWKNNERHCGQTLKSLRLSHKLQNMSVFPMHYSKCLAWWC